MEFEIYKVSKNPTDSAQSIINCQDYIGIFLQNFIEIYELNENLDIKLKHSITDKVNFGTIDFNHKYKDILLSTSPYDYIKLWKIPSINSPEVICTLNGPNSNGCEYAKFNPMDKNLIISSKLNNIDLWDITKYINKNSMKTTGNIYSLKWDLTGDYFGYFLGRRELNINYADDINNNIININHNDIKSFEFKNNNELITFHRGQIVKTWDFRNSKHPKLEKKLDFSFNFELYDKNNNYTYIQSDILKIYDSDNFDNIYQQNIQLRNNSIILDDCFLKYNEISNIIEQDYDGNFNIIKIKNKNNSKSNIIYDKIKEEDIDDSDNFFDNIVYKITDYSNYPMYINKKNDINYKIKNYLGIQKLKMN